MTDGGISDRHLAGERPAAYRTASGIELDAAYTPGRDGEGEQPGIYPFARGVHPEMHRTRLWTRRHQSGDGTPRDSNDRLVFLPKQGMTLVRNAG